MFWMLGTEWQESGREGTNWKLIGAHGIMESKARENGTSKHSHVKPPATFFRVWNTNTPYLKVVGMYRLAWNIFARGGWRSLRQGSKGLTHQVPPQTLPKPRVNHYFPWVQVSGQNLSKESEELWWVEVVSLRETVLMRMTTFTKDCDEFPSRKLECMLEYIHPLFISRNPGPPPHLFQD